ncbi:MAG: hypothetical protein LBP61_07585 [Desulfovibrio sp.]|nr:hypothetical protein [Desulfovibrio sp.]
MKNSWVEASTRAMVLQPGHIPGTPDRIRRVCLIVFQSIAGSIRRLTPPRRTGAG